MDRMRFAWMPLVLLVLASRAVASQTITVAGNPAAMTVTGAIAGSEPFAVGSPATNYTTTTPTANHTYRITGQLLSALPAGLSLVATMTGPAGAIPSGAVTLSTTAQDLVTNIPRNTNFTGTITYQLVATAAAGVVSSQTSNVQLTISRFP
jgi:hypothetical protein